MNWERRWKRSDELGSEIGAQEATKENVSRRRDQVWYHIMEYQKRMGHKSLIIEWVQIEVERIL